MVTEDTARTVHRYASSLNYHGLGKDGLIEVLTKSKYPVAAFAAAPSEDGNTRDDSIVLVTDLNVAGGKAVVI